MTVRPHRFAARTALVTGPSRELGLLIARELAPKGARVMLCARDGNSLDRADRQLRADGVDAASISCDFTDPDAPRRLLDAVHERFGPLDILVNSAGSPPRTCCPMWPPSSPQRASPKGCARNSQGPVSASPRSFQDLMRTGSHTAARFHGRPGAEYRWFATAASMPLLSMDAERAARAIEVPRVMSLSLPSDASGPVRRHAVTRASSFDRSAWLAAAPGLAPVAP